MDNKPNDNPWRGLWIVSAMGADLAVCVTAGYFLGAYVGDWLGGTLYWKLGGVLLGLVAGGFSAAYIIRRFMEDPHG